MKPSEIGLHPTVRYVIYPIGENREDWIQYIIEVAEDLYEVLRKHVRQKGRPQSEVMTRKYARFVSNSLIFVGFSDKEVFTILAKEADRIRKALKR